MRYGSKVIVVLILFLTVSGFFTQASAYYFSETLLQGKIIPANATVLEIGLNTGSSSTYLPSLNFNWLMGWNENLTAGFSFEAKILPMYFIPIPLLGVTPFVNWQAVSNNGLMPQITLNAELQLTIGTLRADLVTCINPSLRLGWKIFGVLNPYLIIAPTVLVYSTFEGASGQVDLDLTAGNSFYLNEYNAIQLSVTMANVVSTVDTGTTMGLALSYYWKL